jgi:hypothetical protein
LLFPRASTRSAGWHGIGKTVFAVHAGHQLAERYADGQILLPLHGHTPGHRPVDSADALVSLLLTVGVAAAQIPPGLKARMALWRDRDLGAKDGELEVLNTMGETFLAVAAPAEARARYEQAREIAARIGSRYAQRVDAVLHAHSS